MTTFTDALGRVSDAAARLAASPTDDAACAEYDAACAHLDAVRQTRSHGHAWTIDGVCRYCGTHERTDAPLCPGHPTRPSASGRPLSELGEAGRAAVAAMDRLAHLAHIDALNIAQEFGHDSLQTQDAMTDLLDVRAARAAVKRAASVLRPFRPLPEAATTRGPMVVAASPDYVPGVSGIAVTGPGITIDPAPRPHGYGAPHASPGYCWCGTWAIEDAEHPGTPGRAACPSLSAIFGRPARSHEDAERLAYLRGVNCGDVL